MLVVCERVGANIGARFVDAPNRISFLLTNLLVALLHDIAMRFAILRGILDDQSDDAIPIIIIYPRSRRRMNEIEVSEAH